MGFSQMDVFIKIVTREPVKNAEGFGSQQDIILFSGRAYKSVTEGGSERWRNEAVFSEELTVFRFRRVPGLKITTEHFIVPRM
ncbi:MAG: head-tail adaptor protein [Eubacteriales bacterium]|nr:head-tail adaptor protein [Eubacteriales bacterium]